MQYIITVFALLTSLFQILNPITAVILKGGEDSFFDKWEPTMEYTDDYAFSIEKDPEKDFIVLNFSDVQLEKWEAYSENGELATATIDKAVSEANPDLITLSGDNAWSTSTYLKLIKDIDSYGIPWAPIMGNHDGSCCISEFWCAYEMYDADNCLFRFGPENMGYGNYVVNVTQNGKVIHSIILMDTHSDLEDWGNINGVQNSGYDNLWENQIEWYQWVVKGIEKSNGELVESTVLIHIPLVEFKTAWNEAYDNDKGEYTDEYKETSFGINHENVGCAPLNNGFFSVCKELGSTKNIIAGHDHINSASILYDGIRLTYSLTCGPGGYWESDMSGATLMTINSAGNNTVSHLYINVCE